MNWNRIGNWTELKGKANRQLARSKEDDLELVSNKRKRHASNNPETYRDDNERADKQLSELRGLLKKMPKSESASTNNMHDKFTDLNDKANNPLRKSKTGLDDETT